MKLKQCPCGRPLDKLYIEDANQGGKYMNVTGNCCGEWTLEFRANYHKPDSPECMELAIGAWNSAPRGMR